MSSAFLFFAALFPRLTLLVCWVSGVMPANHTPFIADVLGAIVAPRLLIAVWAYEAGMHPIIPILFAAMQVMETFNTRVRAAASGPKDVSGAPAKNNRGAK